MPGVSAAEARHQIHTEIDDIMDRGPGDELLEVHFEFKNGRLQFTARACPDGEGTHLCVDNAQLNGNDILGICHSWELDWIDHINREVDWSTVKVEISACRGKDDGSIFVESLKINGDEYSSFPENWPVDLYYQLRTLEFGGVASIKG